MIFPPPLELSLLGLYDPGVPGKERIVLRPTETVNLAQFGILVAYKISEDNVMPLNDNYYWFGEFTVQTPSWIVVFTGEGEPNVVTHPQNGQPVYVRYWGRTKTIFHDHRLVPVIFQISSVLVGTNGLSRLPQTGQ